MPHPDDAHALKIQLATALRERDEAQALANQNAFVGARHKDRADAAESALAAANARADAAEAELAEYRSWSPSRADAMEALAAARRECAGATDWLRVVRDAFGREHCDYCDVKFVEQDGVNEDCGPLHYAIGGVVRYLDHLPAAPIRAALAAPAAAAVYQPVRHALDEARNNIWRTGQQAQVADSTPLHEAFETLRQAVKDLTDSMEKLYEAAAAEEPSR